MNNSHDNICVQMTFLLHLPNVFLYYCNFEYCILSLEYFKQKLKYTSFFHTYIFYIDRNTEFKLLFIDIEIMNIILWKMNKLADAIIFL